MCMRRRRNKQLIRRYYEEVWNEGKLAVVKELLAPAYCSHNPLPGQSSGREGIKKLVSALRASTHNLRCEVEYMVAEKDKVATRITLKGTCERRVDGIFLPGQLTLSAFNVFRLKKRKIVEQWSSFDAENATLHFHKHPATIRERAAGADEHGDGQLRIEAARAHSKLQSLALGSTLVLSIFLAPGGFITAWLMLRLNHDFTGGWTSVVTALLASVAFVVLVAASLNRSGGGTNDADFRDQMRQDPEGAAERSGYKLDEEDRQALKSMDWNQSDQALKERVSKYRARFC